MRIREAWENTPLHCCECSRFIDMVSEENHGYIGAYTICDSCHHDHHEEIKRQSR